MKIELSITKLWEGYVVKNKESNKERAFESYETMKKHLDGMLDSALTVYQEKNAKVRTLTIISEVTDSEIVK